MDHPPLRTRTCTCLFTDIVGSTFLKRSLDLAVAKAVFERSIEIFKECLPAKHVEFHPGTTSTIPDAPGRIAGDTGDGVFAVFDSVLDAMETALKVQWRMAKEEWPVAEPVSIRIGLDVGDATTRRDAVHGIDQPFGTVTDSAARVMGLAAGGQVLMTQGVSYVISNGLKRHPFAGTPSAAGQDLTLQLESHGNYRFKGDRVDEGEAPLEIFEVRPVALGPCRQPEPWEKCWPCNDQGQAVTGWRPLPGLEVPGTSPDKWVLEARIGTGGFGAVWLAHDRSSPKKKRVFKFCYDEARARSFRREKKLFELLNDALEKNVGLRPNIAAIERSSMEGSGDADPLPPFWIQSQYYENGNLLDWAQATYGRPEDGPSEDLAEEKKHLQLCRAVALIPMEVRLRLWVEVARTVEVVHQHGIVHRDIKPTNIFIRLDSSGTPHPVLADFGIGILSDLSRLDQAGFTRGGFLNTLFDNDSSRTGSRLYAPPEAQKGGKAGPSWDIYALGVLLYQLAIGDASQPWESAQECHRRVQDKFLSKIILKALDSETHRFGSAAECADKLDSLEADRAESEEAKLKASLAQARSVARRHRRLLALMSTLTLVAVAGWVYGTWQAAHASTEASNARKAEAAATIANEKTQKASKETEHQREIAQQGFDSTFASLQRLYEDYNNKVIGSIPGVHIPQVRALQAALRDQMRGDLQRLHAEQPEHRGCLVLLCHLEIEAMAAARDEWAWEKAVEPLRTAKGCLKELKSLTPAEMEACADIWNWEPLVAYFTKKSPEGTEAFKTALKDVVAMASKYPASKRLHFVGLRLRNSVLVDSDKAQAEDFLALEREIENMEKMEPGGSDVSFSRLLILGNAYYRYKNPTDLPLSEVDHYLKILEKDILGDPQMNNSQVERTCEYFPALVTTLNKRLSAKEPTTEIPEKLTLLRRLHDVLKQMDKRCPRSPFIYARYGDYLELEKKCIESGIGTRSRSALALELERHKQRAAAFGVPESLRDTLEQSSSPFLKENLSDNEKTSAAASLENAMPDLMSLDLEGVETILVGNNTYELISKLPAMSDTDPMRPLCMGLLNHYISVFEPASLTSRLSHLEVFAQRTEPIATYWKDKKDHDKICSFWNNCYSGIDISSQTSGDRNSLVKEANFVACAFIAAGDCARAQEIYRSAVKLSQNILGERPWDWWVHQALMHMHFEIAKAYEKAGRKTETLECRRAGWELMAQFYITGEKIDFQKFEYLPGLDGSSPERATAAEKAFFASFAPDSHKTGAKMFTIPVDVNGSKTPVEFYILHGKTGYPGLLEQFRWSREYKGIIIPEDVQNAFKKLADIAEEKHLEFLDLCTYALNYSADGDGKHKPDNKETEKVLTGDQPKK